MFHAIPLVCLDVKYIARIKINVRIIDAELNNNSIMVQLFKQEYDGSKWNDTGIDVDQSQKIKQSILIDAQKLKVTLDLN